MTLIDEAVERLPEEVEAGGAGPVRGRWRNGDAVISAAVRYGTIFSVCRPRSSLSSNGRKRSTSKGIVPRSFNMRMQGRAVSCVRSSPTTEPRTRQNSSTHMRESLSVHYRYTPPLSGRQGRKGESICYPHTGMRSRRRSINSMVPSRCSSPVSYRMRGYASWSVRCGC